MFYIKTSVFDGNWIGHTPAMLQHARDSATTAQCAM